MRATVLRTSAASQPAYMCCTRTHATAPVPPGGLRHNANSAATLTQIDAVCVVVNLSSITTTKPSGPERTKSRIISLRRCVFITIKAERFPRMMMASAHGRLIEPPLTMMKSILLPRNNKTPPPPQQRRACRSSSCGGGATVQLDDDAINTHNAGGRASPLVARHWRVHATPRRWRSHLFPSAPTRRLSLSVKGTPPPPPPTERTEQIGKT